MSPGHGVSGPEFPATGAPSVGPRVLVSALIREAKLLSELVTVLQQQRRAVAAEDLPGVDDTIFSAQRILRTLAEARVNRRTLFELLSGDPDLPLDDLEDSLGPRMTPEIKDALEGLERVALELNGELAMNRAVLTNAIQSGEDLIRALRGGGDKDPGLYSPEAGRKAHKGDHGMIIDRQI